MTNAWTMAAEATSMSAVTMWKRPMPPSTSARDPRRAPAIDAANAPLAMTNAASRTNVPRLAMLLSGLPGGARRGVLRGALRLHAIVTDDEAVGAETAFQHHLRPVLEGIGNDAGISRFDHLAVVLD